MADAATAANNAGSILDRINNSRTRLADSTETFLALLTTQLKNQDPLSPMDSTQFTQQLVQMTGVEQQLVTNDLLAVLVGMNDGGLADSVNLIGQTVTADTAEAGLSGGQATWDWKLPRGAANVKLEVVNGLGQTVKTVDMTNVAAGAQTFNWDGKSTAGDAQPDGAYTLRITATDTGGSKVTPTISVTGTVTGVRSVDGVTMAQIGATNVPTSAITSVRRPVS